MANKLSKIKIKNTDYLIRSVALIDEEENLVNTQEGAILKVKDGIVTKQVGNIGTDEQPVYLNNGILSPCKTLLPTSGGTVTGLVNFRTSSEDGWNGGIQLSSWISGADRAHTKINMYGIYRQDIDYNSYTCYWPNKAGVLVVDSDLNNLNYLPKSSWVVTQTVEQTLTTAGSEFYLNNGYGVGYPTSPFKFRITIKDAIYGDFVSELYSASEEESVYVTINDYATSRNLYIDFYTTSGGTQETHVYLIDATSTYCKIEYFEEQDWTMPNNAGQLVTKSDVDRTIQSAISFDTWFDSCYPIGTTYTYYLVEGQAAPTECPLASTRGTWVRIKDTFLYAAGDDDILGSTGGRRDWALLQHNHTATTITSNASAAHTHTYSGNVDNNSHYHGGTTLVPATALTGSFNSIAGGSGSNASGIVSSTKVQNAAGGGSSQTLNTVTINADHTHSFVTDDATHNHSYSGTTSTSSSTSHNHTATTTINNNGTITDGTNQNMPPYIVVYSWYRSA